MYSFLSKINTYIFEARHQCIIDLMYDLLNVVEIVQMCNLKFLFFPIYDAHVALAMNEYVDSSVQMYE